jgi:DNA replication licensing factor MCM6
VRVECRYVAFARTLNPKITAEAKKTIVSCYKTLRQNDVVGSSQIAYRITVRQLESMIRLSEALARLHLDEEIRPMYVHEAFRLLQQSIIRVDTQDIVFAREDLGDADAKAGEAEPEAVSYAKYQRVARLLALHLRHLEDASPDAGKSTRCCAQWLC